MSVFTKVHARRLLTLADILAKSRRYDQFNLTHACGTPACALGHALERFPDLKSELVTETEFFGITYDEAWNGTPEGDYRDSLFGVYGCDDAGRSGKKAAKFIRDLVAKKLAQHAAAKAAA